MNEAIEKDGVQEGITGSGEAFAGGGEAFASGGEAFLRTQMLIGQPALERLKNSKVLVFGIGGVGGYVCEALARGGVGCIHMVDKDVVDITNLNRQIIALVNTIGRPKVEVKGMQCFYLPERAQDFDFAAYDYVVDAVDNVTAKIDIIRQAKAAGVSVISSMGTGNKLDPTKFEVADISKTSVCPLAKVVRKELRLQGIRGVKVVFSKEEPVSRGERTPASISFVPPVAGLIIAGEVINDLIGEKQG